MNFNFTGTPVISNTVVSPHQARASPLGSLLPVPLGSHPVGSFLTCTIGVDASHGLPSQGCGLRRILLSAKGREGRRQELGVDFGLTSLGKDPVIFRVIGHTHVKRLCCCELPVCSENFDSRATSVCMITLLCLSPWTPFFIFLHSLNPEVYT